MPSEFDLIRQFFIRPTRHTLLGAGDDAALVVATPGCELATSTDLLVEGTHFLGDTAPFDQIGRASCRERVYHPV